jgi:hypothetical protein
MPAVVDHQHPDGAAAISGFAFSAIMLYLAQKQGLVFCRILGLEAPWPTVMLGYGTF